MAGRFGRRRLNRVVPRLKRHDHHSDVSENHLNDMIDQDAHLTKAIREDFERTLPARVDRYKRAEHHPIVADSWFAVASSECVQLFRDGHFCGCISLCQAVGEALIRYMCKRNVFRPGCDYEENVRVLQRRGFIDQEFEQLCTDLWNKRNDYHHLNEKIETGRSQLEALALSKVRILAQIEKWVFAYTFSTGCIVLKHPKYWPNEGEGDVRTYLRLSP